MRKFKFFTAFVVVLTLISTLAFADIPSVVLSDTEYADSEFVVTISLSKEVTGTAVIGGKFYWDTDVWEAKSFTGSLSGKVADGNLDILVDDEALTDNKTIGTVTFKLKDGAIAVADTKAFYCKDLVWDWTTESMSYSGGKVNVVIKPVIKEVVVGDTTYTNVATYTGVVKNASGTKLTFDLTDGSNTKNYSENLGDWNIFLENATLNFDVAAVGADSTVTLKNAAVK